METNRAILLPTGEVLAGAVRRLETTCRINLKNFPFDKQTCILEFTTSVLTNYINVTTISIPNMADFTYIFDKNSEWKHVDIEKKLKVDKNNVSVFVLTISMKRNPVFYVLYLVIPSVLMAFVSVTVFLLPPESGERVGLSITVLLSYTVFLLMVSEISPRGGENMSLLGIFCKNFHIY